MVIRNNGRLSGGTFGASFGSRSDDDAFDDVTYEPAEYVDDVPQGLSRKRSRGWKRYQNNDDAFGDMAFDDVYEADDDYASSSPATRRFGNDPHANDAVFGSHNTSDIAHMRDAIAQGTVGARKSQASSPSLMSIMSSADTELVDTVSQMQQQFLRHSTLGGYRQLSMDASGSASQPHDPMHLRVELHAPTGDDDDIHWTFKLQIFIDGHWYRIQKIPTLMRSIRKGLQYHFSTKWDFVPKRAMFEDSYAPLLNALTAICQAYTAANAASFAAANYGMRVPYNTISISQEQLAQLLHAAGQTDAEIAVDDPQTWRSTYRPSQIVMTDSDAEPSFPDLGLSFLPQFDASQQQLLAFTITHSNKVLNACTNGKNAFMFIEDAYGQPYFQQVPLMDMQQFSVLQALCNSDMPLVLAQQDFAHFANAVTPVLMAFGQVSSIPQPLQSQQHADCTLKFYLDRTDDDVIICEAFAEYGQNLRFNVFSEPVTLAYAQAQAQASATQARSHNAEHRQTENRQSANTANKPTVVRDEATEEFARQAVGIYFHTPYAVARPGNVPLVIPDHVPHTAPYVSLDATGELLRLYTEGLTALRSIGEVYTTDKVTKIMRARPAQVRMGLSVKGDLVRISPLADEIDPQDVVAILDSYRRRKQYHRLADGTFIKIDGGNIAKSNDLVERYHLSLSDLARGTAELPAMRAFMLDAEDESVIEEAPSFKEFVGEVRVVDPMQYEPPADLNATLRSYQLTGHRWLRTLMDKHLGGILADEMGLGKTIQLISVLLVAYSKEQQKSEQEQRDARPSLVVCPASLVYNWAREIQKFAPTLPVTVISGSKAHRKKLYAHLSGVVVTSYDLFRLYSELLEQQPWLVMSLDEAQAIKNPATKIAKAVKSAQAAHRFALTGTPIENRLSELWSIFDFLMPGFLGSYRAFKDTFEKPILDGRADVSDRLQHAIQPFILRRLKQDVLKDLPDKIETVIDVPLEGEQRKLYATHERKLKMMLASSQNINEDRFQVLAALTQLRQLCCDARLLYENAKDGSAKLTAILELVQSAQESGQKVLIFSQFVSFLELIGDKLTEAGFNFYEITGSTAKKRRLELVDKFNADDTPVFLISLKAGGTGLNLTGASVVIHADPWWNEAAQDQATDRAHRIGQKHTVNVYKVVASDTIEERIVQLQIRKSELAHALLDAESTANVAAMTRDDILALLD
ncbi:SNF2 family protein [Bifidobacterium dolichotidis]|uniref:SNF2 family protein n=1 Tax=Bifidobacterium dolichotidis TaxID=2306976 RepID=A0A430FRS9_9BIFI|nr:DEAD/DEAH box helicase [Bifidobacterium dolichotidis]RSX55586.1 SNF2 family protein [Bifidobacterium dolichotidis]